MIKVTVQKNLIGMEDLLTGTGTVEQTRGPLGTDPTTITKINGAIFPYDENNTMQQKFDALQIQLDSLPDVVDENGNLLAGYIQSSELNLNLDSPDRIWNKEIDNDTAEIYYGDTLLFQYDPTDGNILIPGGTDYVAADAVVTAAFEAADTTLQGNIDALDAQTEAIHDLDVGTAANNLVQLDGTAKLPAVDGSQLTGISTETIPIGAIFAVPYSTPDTNYLECDGSEVSRTTYADLFAKIGTDFGVGDGSTTFNLPDYRGEFLRGWDNGKGTDSGRTINSFQTDELKSHTHTHSRYRYTNASASMGGTTLHQTTTGTTGATGGAETRPRNYAVMYQIKVL